MALFGMRPVIHENTGLSPSEIVHGHNLRRIPHAAVFKIWLNVEETYLVVRIEL